MAIMVKPMIDNWQQKLPRLWVGKCNGERFAIGSQIKCDIRLVDGQYIVIAQHKNEQITRKSKSLSIAKNTGNQLTKILIIKDQGIDPKGISEVGIDVLLILIESPHGATVKALQEKANYQKASIFANEARGVTRDLFFQSSPRRTSWRTDAGAARMSFTAAILTGLTKMKSLLTDLGAIQ
jgi:hypothetical protein